MAVSSPAAEVRLKRFLYTSTEEPRYTTSDAYYHKYYTPEKVKVVTEILQSNNPELLLNIVEIVNSENLLPRRETLFFILALAATLTTDEKFKNKLYTTLTNSIKSSQDIFEYVKFYSIEQKKFSSAINKFIGAYYVKQDPFELAEEVIKTKGYHSWTHKDLIKLSHHKCDSVLTRIVIAYVLHGLEKAKLIAEGNSEADKIMVLLSNATELKRCENEERIAELVTVLGCNLKQVPSYFHRSQAVWEALIPVITIAELITYLPRLYKLGFLKANSLILNRVLEALNNPGTIKTSAIHPIELFIGLKNFEKGGKPLDPKLALYLETKEKNEDETKKSVPAKDLPKCPLVVAALNKAMQTSFQNLTPTGRRIMIGVEISDNMDLLCLSNKNISSLDAATIVILSLLKIEKDVTVAVFNGTKISIVPLDKNISYNQAQAKLKQAKNGVVLLSPIFEWAMNRKKQVDVFINFFYHHWFSLIPTDLRLREKPLHMLNSYRKKMSLPHTKLISISASSSDLRLADGSSNVLDICGFSKEVPKIIEAFSKGLFY